MLCFIALFNVFNIDNSLTTRKKIVNENELDFVEKKTFFWNTINKQFKFTKTNVSIK